MSRDCVFTNKQEANVIKKQLKKLNRAYIPVNGDLHHCFYEAILCNLDTPQFPKCYNSLNLRNQICMFIIENFQFYMTNMKIRLQAGRTSLYHFILKHMDFFEWGEEALLPIICKMWHVTIAVFDPLCKDRNKSRIYGITFGSPASHSLAIIYNTINHFTGTGYYFILFL